MSSAGPTFAPTPRTPTVLRTLAGAVLLDRGGDIELERETRGARMDWGGVYGQLVRLTGAWRLALEVGGETFALPATCVSATVDGERFASQHRCGDVEVVQQVVPLTAPPGALRTLTLRSRGSAPTPVTLSSSFDPFLLPVLVEGIRPVDVQLETRAEEIRVRQRGFALSFRTDPLPSRLYVDRASWRGGRRRGRCEELGSDHEVVLADGRPTDVRFVVVGGLERDLDRQLSSRADPLSERPEEVARRLAEDDGAWIASTPRMSLPDAPELERAYERARLGLRRLYSNPANGLTGLVAGYPWYSAIWCRDLAWMLPAVLWLGDFGWAERSIGSVLEFQATSELPLLGGQAGEIPMQVSPGPVFLFGTSDTTLHYPTLSERALRHTGDLGVARRWCDAVRRAIAWAERRTDPETGLLRNGGEIEAAERSEAGLGWVRYGIEAPDTTIWDSADRRDHAIDIQVLWSRALRSAAVVSRAEGSAEDEAARFEALAGRVERSIRQRYLWPEERYLVDSLRAGAPVRHVRPNALRAISAGVLDPEVARSAVRRAAEPDLTTPWGVRTLASGDPGYSPTAYHDGQVWPIATAWAADAAWAVEETELGMRYLRALAEGYRHEGGSANECFRGDRDEPFDSCFLLGLSLGPFLTTVFERLWGLEVDARVPELTVRPAFPSDWHRARLDRLSVGPGVASLRYEDGAMEVAWNGPGPLEVVGRRDRTTVAPGGAVRLTVA